MATTFSNKCHVLAQLYVDSSYIDRIPPVLDEFIETEGYTLALAYIISKNYADVNDETIRIIDETFDTLIQTLDIEDTGFNELSDIFS